MSIKLPTLQGQQQREHEVFLQVEKTLFETYVAPLINPEIVDEHRRSPIGHHSDALERVLIHLRKGHHEMAGKYILVCTKPHEEWRIAEITGNPHEPPVLLEGSYSDRYEAEHGLFLKRLADNGLLPTEGA